MNSTNHGLTVLLDRDGVINRNRSDYVKSWEEFEFLPGSLEALRMLAEQGARVVVTTNQSAVGRGLLSRGGLDLIHARMTEEIEAHGGRLAAVLCCPHSPDDGCLCRKPQPGLLLEAVDRFQLDPDLCYVVGDSLDDLMAAHAVGMRYVMVLTGRGLRSLMRPSDWGCRPSWVARDLKTATHWMLRREGLLERKVA
jgi:D-glycero-D-manno-heptose 1,7-bisphosphate phosphatase